MMLNWVSTLRKAGYFGIREPVLLFLDDHLTRNNEETKRIFQNAGITCIIFPGRLTHVLLPNDRVMNRQWRRRNG